MKQLSDIPAGAVLEIDTVIYIDQISIVSTGPYASGLRMLIRRKYREGKDALDRDPRHPLTRFRRALQGMTL